MTNFQPVEIKLALPNLPSTAEIAASAAWRTAAETPSLAEANASVAIPAGGSWGRKLLAFSGPGMMVAVGYMDPGNWATDLAGGSGFGYALLSVVLLSSLMGMLLQTLSARLGIVTGRDLAQACRDHYSRPVCIGLWLLCEVAICACDLAEVIGSAIALQLLFGLPLIWGVCLTAGDVFVILWLQHRGFRYVEALVAGLIGLIAVCFGLEIVWSHPHLPSLLHGFLPTAQLLRNPQMLYVAIGILGATVMPHNLYLHSSVVQTRAYERTPAGRREAIHFATVDSTLSLGVAFFINAAILILSAATFYTRGNTGIAEIQDAYRLLAPTLGVGIAGTVFALALLAAGQNSTLTGTLAGQIVMEGFLRVRLRPWLRRMITRLAAIVPAVVVIVYFGEAATGRLLLLSQVILSLQLSFAMVPLILFTSDRAKMGEFVTPLWMRGAAWGTAGLIILFNLKYLADLTGLSKMFG